MNCDGRQMGIAGVKSHAMVDFDRQTVGPSLTRENHGTGGRRNNLRTPGTAKIQTRMESITARKRITARTKTARAVKSRSVDRHGKRNMPHRSQEKGKAILIRGGLKIRPRESDIRDTRNPHLIERNLWATHRLGR